MRTYATMLKNRPDFFIHCGDNIYADCVIPPERTLPNGEIWRNLVTAEKSKPAETLAEFRGNYKYNLLDRNLRAFNAEVATLALWDNHEVMDEWWPAKPLHGGDYSAGNVLLLSARAARAFHEYMPVRQTMAEPGRIYRRISCGPLLDVFMLDLRSYRGSNAPTQVSTYGPDAHLLGPAQLAWLKRELARSRTTWKAVVSAAPIGIVAADDATWPAATPYGRAIEIADLLSFMRRARVCNTIWLAADLHYTAAHVYSPARAPFRDFDPFWEFVSGPIHAGTWRPCALSPMFGPEVVYRKASNNHQGDDLAPCFGLQFFGRVSIDGATEVMTVSLKDVEDKVLWSVELAPARPRPDAACLMVSS
jgi:alkaline phosphatase D